MGAQASVATTDTTQSVQEQTPQSVISQSLKGSLTRDMFLLESSPSSADSSLTCTLAVLLAVARDTLFTIGWAFSRAAHTGRITF